MHHAGFTTIIPLTMIAIASLPFGSGAQSNQDEPIKLRGQLVVLDVQALQKKNATAIDNLGREDFVLHEDGVKQHISHFSRDKLPLSVVILMDVSGSVATDSKSIQRLLQGCFEALKLLKPEDEVALIQFAEKATLLQPFTRDRDLVVRALAKLDGRGQRGTHVATGVLNAAQYIRTASNPDSRRAIVAITDDVTVELTKSTFLVPTTRGERDALNELYESGSVLCGLLYESSQSNLDEPYLRKGVAKRFAEATGGIVIQTSEEAIPARLSEMIERLRQRYAIGYSPSNTSPDGKFRKIKLNVTREVEKREGGVALITRKGYYAK